jgi:hypothetical protein
MFSVCKVVNFNPEMAELMSSTLFVFDDKTKQMAAIQFTFDNAEPKTLELLSCNEGPDTFQELLAELNSKMDNVPDRVAMFCKENISGIKKIGTFAAAHLKEVFSPSTLREIEGTFTKIIKDCFPKAK